MDRIDVSVWGSTGYAGTEIVGILEGHQGIASIHEPIHGANISDLEIVDTAFLALPHGESAQIARQLREVGSKVIDLSGDLRFPTAEEYEVWYKTPHMAPELLPVPYGLPEFNRDQIVGSRIVSIPGCYPTAALLGLLPLVKNGLTSPDSVFLIDAMSGASGAGKKLTQQTHFMDLYSNAVPYKIGREHQHVGEMELLLEGHSVFFSPVLLAIDRGILSKSTVQLAEGVSYSDLYDALQDTYMDEPFVSVLPKGEIPTLKETSHRDVCHLGVVSTGQFAQVVCSIDNLRKGAASQSVQVFNLINGFDETTALTPKGKR